MTHRNDAHTNTKRRLGGRPRTVFNETEPFATRLPPAVIASLEDASVASGLPKWKIVAVALSVMSEAIARAAARAKRGESLSAEDAAAEWREILARPLPWSGSAAGASMAQHMEGVDTTNGPASARAERGTT